MKRITALLLSIMMIVSLFSFSLSAEEPEPAPAAHEVWDGSVATAFAGGDGSKDNPYLISNGAQLAYLAELTVSKNVAYDLKYYKLTADIYLNDLTDYDRWSVGSEGLNKWTPIGGNNNNNFSGHVDGAGHTVYGMYIAETAITAKENDSLGLFGYVHRAGNATEPYEVLVENLCVAYGYIGVSAQTLDTELYIGGVTGQAARAKIGNCSTDVRIEVQADSVTKNLTIGGIVGYSAIDISISRCSNLGNISVTAEKVAEAGAWISVGGIYGSGRSATADSGISACYNTGNLTCTVGEGPVKGMGGIAGTIGAGDTGALPITDCYNTGKLGGSSNSTGGIVGFARAQNQKITNCFNTGECEFQMIACAWGTTGLYNCYYNKEISEKYVRTYPGGWLEDHQQPKGLTPAELTSGQMEGFSADVWKLSAGTYPTLKDIPVADPFAVLGATIREKYTRFYADGELIAEGQGLLFGFALNRAELLETEDVTVGVIVGDGSSSLTYETAAYRIKAENSLQIADGTATFSGYIIGIDQAHFDTELSARAYLMVGDRVVMYSDVMVRSVAGVAAAADGSLNEAGDFVRS